MKKWFVFLAFLMVPMWLFAQEPEVPVSVSDLLGNLSTFFGTVAGLAGVTIFLTAVIITAVKVEKKWVKMVLAWGVSLVLAVLSNLLNFGYLAEANWIATAAWGVGFGLVANGVFDIPTVQTLTQFLLSLLTFKKPE